MHTSTAVIATDLVEISAVIRKHDIGVVLDSLTVENLATAINALLNDPDRLAGYTSNCALAAKTENWENETKILNEIYPRVDD